MLPLGLLAPGERAEVVELMLEKPSCQHCRCPGASPHSLCRLGDLGLRVGKTVEVLNASGAGALLVKVDEARIAMNRGVAMKIKVRRKA
ncbi:MAG: ferrous iron transport protein A [Deltaproteobacteria bacterium]|nr:ferrous iron transport protein A [Deltaproteobacteria bacterium]MBI4795214.1 ferrous iron transport protein A [Deltaproteobacteria bacterium]